MHASGLFLYHSQKSDTEVSLLGVHAQQVRALSEYLSMGLPQVSQDRLELVMGQKIEPVK